jgi:hypothetical protein
LDLKLYIILPAFLVSDEMNIKEYARQASLAKDHPLGLGTLLNNPGKALY